MAVIVKKTGHVTTLNKVKAHIKYIGFRSQEIEREDGDIFKFPKGQFFNDKFNNVNYKHFIKGIEENNALKFPKSIKAHKFVFSLDNFDYKAYTDKGKEFKDLIRDTIESYEKDKGVKLNWIATEHIVDGKGKSHHPHCHVVICGVSELNKDGKYTRIKFNKEDFKNLRETFNSELKKEIGNIEKKFPEKDKSIMNDVSKGFEMVFNEIQKDVKKKEYEKQAIRKMEINRKEQSRRYREERSNNDRER